jgi:hypothetical protein
MTVQQIHVNLIEQLKRFVALGVPEHVSAAKAMCRAAGISEEEVRGVIDAELGARR